MQQQQIAQPQLSLGTEPHTWTHLVVCRARQCADRLPVQDAVTDQRWAAKPDAACAAGPPTLMPHMT